MINPTTKFLRLLKAATISFSTLGSASTAVIVARCAMEFAPEVTCPCILVQALAINSGAPIYPILHPVIANAFATPFTVIVFSNIPGMEAILQKVPEKLMCS